MFTAWSRLRRIAPTASPLLLALLLLLSSISISATIGLAATARQDAPTVPDVAQPSTPTQQLLLPWVNGRAPQGMTEELRVGDLTDRGQLQAQDQPTQLLLPLISGRTTQVTKEEFAVAYATASVISAVDGRVTINVPVQALPYNSCTLTVMTPDAQAAWLEAYVYIICQQGFANPPVYLTELYKPITIALDYAKIDLTYLDETRLTMKSNPSYDWVPEIDGWKPMPEAAAEQADSIWQTSVNVAAKQVIVSTNRTFVVPRIALGYAITDLARGPGGAVYAVAAPIIYNVGANGALTRLANLAEMPAAAELMTSFSRIGVNTTSGEIYLALRGKIAGSPLKVYALQGNSLKQLYTVPAGEDVSALAVRPKEKVVYLAISKITDTWFGCPIRDNVVRAIKMSDGTEVGDISLSYGYIKAISALTVDATGRLLATQPTSGCDSSGYTGAHLLTASSTATLSQLASYPGFRGANFLTSDDQGRTYIANSTSNAISVVSGADSEIVGYLAVDHPGPLAAAGSTLYVIVNGRITTFSTSKIISSGNDVTLLTQTLSGSTAELRVTASAFAAIPAHNVLYFNGVRYLMSSLDENMFTGLETELSYLIDVPQPQPLAYKPLTEQTATVVFKVNGGQVAATTIASPETPYLEWDGGLPDITIAQYRWVRVSTYGSLSSQEGLFPDIPANGLQWLFIQFKQLGVYHFLIQEEGYPDKLLSATVDAYGDYTADARTVDAAQGATLWVGGAAFEIPANALPAQTDGYKVTFASAANGMTLNDAVSARSPIYTFAFAPEVLHLNQELRLHLPDTTDNPPVMAFYDPLLNDPYTIPSIPDPSAASSMLLTLPAGDYPAAESDTLVAQSVGQPSATQPSWLRRALNWLGSTGVWHAVGLPNDKMETNHFLILFNKNDCTPTYAGVLLDALEEAYVTFDQQGATMPSEQVYVKVAPWVATSSTPGLTPGIGSLFHFYMFFNNKLADEALQDTAVHEFMHVLQKTNATPDGRYMNPLWWEEATANWAQYNIYPDHDTYYLDIKGDGERWLRNAYSNWNSMSTAEMYAAMSLAEYLTQNYGTNAVFNTFHEMRVDWGEMVGVQEAIEIVTHKKFDDFYEEFAKAYWLQTFEPVKTWAFLDSLTGTAYNQNTILRVGINQPLNTVFGQGNIPQLSSGLLKIHAIDPLPTSFTRDTSSSTGSVARIANTCTGNVFRFYDDKLNAIPDLYFNGEAIANQDEILYAKNLGNLTLSKPIYLLYIDRSYKYAADCTPVLTLEQPTITGLSPNSVAKNTTATITIYGGAFGPNQGSVSVSYTLLPAARIVNWTPTAITFTWDTGSTPGTVTVQVYTKKSARSNGMTLTITP